MSTPLLDGFALLIGATAGIIDARTGRIPNWLTLPAAGAGLLANWALGGHAGLAFAAVGLVAAALVPWVLHRVTQGRAIGGGDVKLFAALGALRGPTAGLEIELSACILLGVFALVRLAFAGRLLRVLANAARLLTNPVLPKRWRRPIEAEALTEMRMGPAILAAVLYVVAADRLTTWLPWLA
jgi:prepilin peptidase CpaA